MLDLSNSALIEFKQKAVESPACVLLREIVSGSIQILSNLVRINGNYRPCTLWSTKDSQGATNVSNQNGTSSQGKILQKV